MREREDHGRPRPARSARGRQRCGPARPRELSQELLRPRELYVGTLTGPEPALWRVPLGDDRRTVLGAAPSAQDADAVLCWAARQLLTAALRYDVSATAVRALADDLVPLAKAELELSDLEIRLWFLGWRLQRRAG